VGTVRLRLDCVEYMQNVAWEPNAKSDAELALQTKDSTTLRYNATDLQATVLGANSGYAENELPFYSMNRAHQRQVSARLQACSTFSLNARDVFTEDVSCLIVSRSKSVPSESCTQDGQVFLMSPPEQALLNRQLAVASHYFEFGAGGSTYEAAAAKVPCITSVDSSPEWMQKVKVRLTWPILIAQQLVHRPQKGALQWRIVLRCIHSLPPPVVPRTFCACALWSNPSN
jgi:hypothetical protein